MFKFFFCWLLLFTAGSLFAQKNKEGTKRHFFKADNKAIQYIGRVDFSNPLHPRFWAPGVYINATFEGSYCSIIVNDEVLGGNNHNYLEIVVDDQKPVRVQTRKKTDTIVIAKGLTPGRHRFMLCKDTESGIGYIEIAGIICSRLLASPQLPARRMEFVGNSITCGTGMDQSAVPCHAGAWEDQHNAYMSYGAVTARTLNAQWHLTSVSGIGLMHSCCNLDLVMGQVFDKVNMRGNAISWDFNLYQPDVITICLGQNDGVQDSISFCNNYRGFIGNVRSHYTKADIVCLTSPMADSILTPFLKRMLTGLVEKINSEGDKKVSSYFFKKRYHNGCDEHPDMQEHRQIADELTAYVKKLKNW